MTDTFPKWFRPRLKRILRALIQEYSARHSVDKTIAFCTQSTESWRLVLGVDEQRRTLFHTLLSQTLGQDKALNTSTIYEITKLDVDSKIATLALAARDKDVWIDGPPALHTRSAISLGILDAFLDGQNDPRLLSLAFGDLTQGIHVALLDEVLRILEPGINDTARRAWKRLSAKAHAHSTQGACAKLISDDQRSAKLLMTATAAGPKHPSVVLPPIKRAKKSTTHPQVRSLFAP